jgi:hypothetical protein
MRVLQQEYVADYPMGQLAEYPGNPRRGDVEAISESLDANGFYGAIVVDRETNQILAGNHRYKAALVSEAPSIPVFLVKTDSPDHARRINLGDNAYGAKGSTDEEALLASLKELADLAGSGYTDREMSDLEMLMSVPQAGAGSGGGSGGDPDDELFWPEIKLKVTPDTMDRWRDALDHHQGENDVVKLLALLAEVEAGREPRGDIETREVPVTGSPIVTATHEGTDGA